MWYLRWLSIAVLIAAGISVAQAQRLVLPTGVSNATLPEQCNQLRQEWSILQNVVNQRHEVCLQSQACKGTTSGFHGACSCSACEGLHEVMDRFSRGDLASARDQQVNSCQVSVTAYQARQREERERSRIAEENQRRYQEQMRQDADRQLRQRQEEVTRQQRDQQQREQMTREQQQRDQQAHETQERQRAAALQTWQQNRDRLNTARTAAITAATAKAVSTLDSEAIGRLVERGGAAVSSGVLEEATVKRNDFYRSEVNKNANAAKQAILDSVPQNGVIKAIQDAAYGQIKAQMQQTLGDLDSLKSSIDSFAVAPSGSSAGAAYSPLPVGTPIRSYGEYARDPGTAPPGATVGPLATMEQARDAVPVLASLDELAVDQPASVPEAAILYSLDDLANQPEPSRAGAKCGPINSLDLVREHSNGTELLVGSDRMRCRSGAWVKL